MHATAGSVPLDLAVDKHLALSTKIQCYKISIGAYCPLPPGTLGMVLGRSSFTFQEFIVHPGIIDEDFKGEIKIMAYVKTIRNVI